MSPRLAPHAMEAIGSNNAAVVLRRHASSAPRHPLKRKALAAGVALAGLLLAGCVSGLGSSIYGKDLWESLQAACAAGNAEACANLRELEIASLTDECSSRGGSACQVLRDNGYRVPVAGQYHEACSAGDVDACVWLLRHGIRGGNAQAGMDAYLEERRSGRRQGNGGAGGGGGGGNNDSNSGFR